MKNKIIPLLFIFSLLLTLPLLYGQQIPGIPIPMNQGIIDLDIVRAREEFRIGVQAYYSFAYNDAIRSLELALSYRPGEPLILDWLGKAYYRSGFENAAFSIWQAAAEAYGFNTGQGMLIANRVETLRNRRVFLPVPNDDVRYVESGSYPGMNNDVVLYRQPSSILSLNDGTAWVVAYGSNEIVRIDPNGIIRDRRRGPMVGFDRPYDLVRGRDGYLYLSEFRGNRISVLSPTGDWQYYIGSRGQGPGQFIGPQNLTVDDEGYLYVVDYGNRRISKFDPSGAFILSFGNRSLCFQGFTSPTGIAALGGIIYAADSIHGRIYMFDTNGTYLGVFLDEGISAPESLRTSSDGNLLIVDSNRILLVNPNTAIIRELGLVRNAHSARITGADIDSNGNILAADFRSSDIAVMTRIDDLAAGLFVEIKRVNADNFPRVLVEVEVTDRLRRPVMGLEGGNFLLSEGGVAVREQSFLSASYRAQYSNISILIERSFRSLVLEDNLVTAVREITSSLPGLVSIVSAGEQPFRESLDTAGMTPAARLTQAARGNVRDYTDHWRFDLGLRLAATDLLAAGDKRAVVFVGSGASPGTSFSYTQFGLGELAFDHYSLSELASYLRNNNIAFYAVIISHNYPGDDIIYLAEETGGQVLSLFRNEGIIAEINTLNERASGNYVLSFRSSLATDFGRAYLPLEVEVYLMDRSGRDSSGYFPPLE